MHIPDRLQAEIEQRLGTPLITVTPMGGSFGAQLTRVRTRDMSYALKWAIRGPARAMVVAEAYGLRRLADAGSVRVPRVVADDDGTCGIAFVLSDWITSNGMEPDQALLGTNLAQLHRTTQATFGLEQDNFLGGTPQANSLMLSWTTFFRECRLLPQIKLAVANGFLTTSRHAALDRLVDRLEEWLAIPGEPALIHGDLWSGNLVGMADGTPILIDPAVSFSHREAELAYTELFGGFGPRFYAAYQAAWPLEPGYAERRDLYNLYHLLNHLNLFGLGYAAQVDQIVCRYVG
ncbi:fructosamine kinase family protein [Candidatus Chloroploca sp. M-50]|uniref:Fructosamine kinase family protein n=1 Tax=Candidatus Chloroploca mongolica TaxID=2528176 RepID=A0ABS4D8K9_9CHLR|nr:fructosamine kinase family protein [Candidatus Chloroploca mongolica]MBP1465768.1 fructosamine kinase family protein [Candidatus Chloroploca mongolica]